MPPFSLDFSKIPLADDAFSTRPMTFWPPEAKQTFAALAEVIALETGDEKARTAWQKAQLANLLKRAHERSPFWRKRIGGKKIKDIALSELPVLTRSDLTHQVKTEGPLLRPEDGMRFKSHASSGSSGVPAEFFISEMNVAYNQVRSLAQYFMEGRDLSLNRTRLKHHRYDQAQSIGLDRPDSFTVEIKENWLGSLGKVIKGGINKEIGYWYPAREAILAELAKHRLGYLIALPSIIESLFANDDVSFLKDNGTALFIPLGESVSPQLRQKFDDAKIGVRAGYSAEETGLIASECPIAPGHYHVSHSNVIVEAGTGNTIMCGDQRLSPVLVTCLHSYATPIIRYDLSDLATVEEGCKCGHEGRTLSNIVGRSKNLISHADGRLSLFLMRSYEVTNIAPCREYRVRQTSMTDIVLEIGGASTLTQEQLDRLAALIRGHANGDFNVAVKAVETIDWGQNQKRLGFVNEIL